MIGLRYRYLKLLKPGLRLAAVAAHFISSSQVQSRVCLLVLLFSMIFVSGCASPSRYVLDRDMGPAGEVDISHISEPIPVATKTGRRGNKSPYKVFGVSYHVMASGQGYVEEGVASWYGKKFHGYQTSNGEIYDMYRYSAAHKSLPLPVYARVTNLANGRQVVVRVNDRGPFHGDRLIDLSYAAAKKLGYLASGTARVRVEAFPFKDTILASVESPPSRAIASHKTSASSAAAGTITSEEYFLQVGAFGDRQSAMNTIEDITAMSFGPVFLQQVGSQELYRVRVGPIGQYQQATRIQNLLRESRYPGTFFVSSP